MLPYKEAQKKHFGDENPLIASMNQLMSPSRMPPAEKWVKMKLPYQTSDELPAPIPTTDEIEKARGTDNDLTACRGPFAFHDVYRLHDVYAVKLSRSPIILQEAENLLFLEQHSRVRVPKVYAVFSHQGSDPRGLLKDKQEKDRSELPTYHYLVMEYVSGQNYQQKEDWDRLSQKAKKNICRKISQQLSLLGEVPSPSYYGRVGHQGFYPNYSILRGAGQGFHGPYYSHKDFICDVYTTCEYTCVAQNNREDYDDASKLYLESLKRCMDNASGKEPRLVHTDLCLQNVVAQPKTEDPEDFDVVIIDWATMAWMPTYIQAANILCGCPSDEDRPLYRWGLSQGIKPFPHDSAKYFNDACAAMWVMIE